MSRFTRFAVVLLLVGAAGSALGACQSLAGIKDRTYDGNGAGDAGSDGGVAPSEQCQQYCTLADQVCNGANALYADRQTCLGICNLLPAGEDIEVAPDSVKCRINQLNTALQVTPGEPGLLPDYCAKAGPGGNGTCGTNCESYCLLYAGACQDDQPQLGDNQYDPTTCASKCKGLKDLSTFDSPSSYDGDTLQCRLYHTSAATVNPKEHCVHAQLQAQAQAKPQGPCIDDPTETKPDCDSYCQLEMAECDGEHAVFESLTQCKAVCGALPQGSVADIKENSVGCRKYHSYNALVDPTTHCPHTGPGGDGHCGSSDMPSAETVSGNCESYCILLSKACTASVANLDVADTFAGHFKTQAACQQECGNFDGAKPNSGYSVAPLPEGNTLQCRLLHVSRALMSATDAFNECSAALGGAPCQ